MQLLHEKMLMKEQTPVDPRYLLIISRLKQAREQSGMSQLDAANQLRKPQWYVSRCETGVRRVDVLELLEFSRIYEKEITFFLQDLFIAAIKNRQD